MEICIYIETNRFSEISVQESTFQLRTKNFPQYLLHNLEQESQNHQVNKLYKKI